MGITVSLLGTPKVEFDGKEITFPVSFQDS